jgi:hypothetical protein
MQAQLLAEPARNFLVGIADGIAAVDRHVGNRTAQQQGIQFRCSQRTGIVERHEDVLETARRAVELAFAPQAVAGGIVEVEGIAHHPPPLRLACAAPALAGVEQAREGFLERLYRFRRFDFHHLVDRPQAILLRQHFLQAGRETAPETEVRPLFRVTVVGVFAATGVEQVEEMALALARLDIGQEHVAVVLDRRRHALRQRGGEFHALFGFQLAIGDAIRRQREENHELDHEVEIGAAEVDVVLGLAHALDRIDRQLPAQNRDDAGQFRHRPRLAPGVETAADADGHALHLFERSEPTGYPRPGAGAGGWGAINWLCPKGNAKRQRWLIATFAFWLR